MPRLSPYNPEAEPRAGSWCTRLGWGNGRFSTENTMQKSRRTTLGGMFEGACGGLLGKMEKIKERNRNKRQKRVAEAEHCGRQQHEEHILPTVHCQSGDHGS